MSNLPIIQAAIPVGAMMMTLGWLGSSPICFSALSQCLATTLMTVLFPTPPPPTRVVHDISLRLNLLLDMMAIMFSIYNLP